jgi:hypothetical protein
MLYKVAVRGRHDDVSTLRTDIYPDRQSSGPIAQAVDVVEVIVDPTTRRPYGEGFREFSG